VETVLTGKLGAFRVALPSGRYYLDIKVANLPDCLCPSGMGTTTRFGSEAEVVVGAGRDSSLKYIECQSVSDPFNPSHAHG
jgi:hypothetical protein